MEYISGKSYKSKTFCSYSHGSIINKPVLIDNKIENREHLCLTVSFDHDIVDGAPAARFMNDLIEEIKSGRSILDMLK